MIVAQTIPPIPASARFNRMHVTTLVKKGMSEVVRYGLKCDIIEVIDDYRLGDGKPVPAIVLKNYPPPRAVNIRRAYRLRPNPSFDVAGKLLYHREECISGRHFKVHDVSLTGIGLLIPKLVDGRRNPLMGMEPGAEIETEWIFKEPPPGGSITTVSNKIKVVRFRGNYSRKYGFAGFAFERMKKADEERLARFIHEAQLHEIRHLRLFP